MANSKRLEAMTLLVAAVPDPGKGLDLTGVGPRAIGRGALDPTAGCRFRERCPLAIEPCSRITPELAEASPGHSARCHVTAPRWPASA